MSQITEHVQVMHPQSSQVGTHDSRRLLRCNTAVIRPLRCKVHSESCDPVHARERWLDQFLPCRWRACALLGGGAGEGGGGQRQRAREGCFTADSARTRCTQFTSWGCWKTSSRRPRCSSQHVMRCPYTCQGGGHTVDGAHDPSACSASARYVASVHADAAVDAAVTPCGACLAPSRCSMVSSRAAVTRLCWNIPTLQLHPHRIAANEPHDRVLIAAYA